MSEFLFNSFAAGFEKAFNEFKKQQEQRDMALLDTIQTLKDNDASIEAHVQEIVKSLVSTNADKDAQIKDLLNQVATGTKTLQDAQAAADALVAQQQAELQALNNLYNPPATPAPTPAPATDSGSTPAPAPTPSV